MPIAHAFSGGLADGNSIAFPIDLPSIERQASAIDFISVVRGGGRLLTDGDQSLVGLSHQTDITTVSLTDDEDDFLSDRGTDLWWVHGISETDHVLDRLDVPELVAGPQTVVWFNGTSKTIGVRVDVGFHMVPVSNITRWALLKQLTSYETLL